MKVSVVIPNWQGRSLLERNLPGVVKLGAQEIIVVDDGSSDGSAAYVKEKFPKIHLIQHTRNLGFAKSVNDGVEKARGDIVILLNTDVLPQKDLLKATLPHFKDPDIFAVSFNEGKYSFAMGLFNKGLIEHRPGGKSNKAESSFWASGGSAAFEKKKWQELGGLDLLYIPFYWEDVDVCYRAQARGWKIIWEPKARVTHQHEVTIGRYFPSKEKAWIAERNQILFFWSNISSPAMWARHLFWMPVRLLRLGYWLPFLRAWLKIPPVVLRRIKNFGTRKVSDEEILKKFSS